MIGYLRGEIIHLEMETVILKINGIGFEIELAGFTKLPSLGEKIEIFIYTYVREDALKLFGFPKKSDKELFEILINVNGIGPRAALNIINSMPTDRFISAILQENQAILKEISGIGPKTAQRLILELQSKLEEFAAGLNTVQKYSEHSAEDRDDIIDALLSLGYNEKEIAKALQEMNFNKDTSVSEKIRRVLSYLGKER
ncbi:MULTISPECIES: Holliday junction branch migration protein RuvA [unclassified Halanaerobium]|uniref:Holliday junction branch migration protein RuvA n=1 Tax=unclassified Halanaerobium TaxID=2641197 RepID=UPI000DF1CF73|nr:MULTISPECIES: Holliday junction branch migration protein RuvA [unclassified Halanaerobium]RCW43777.1 Holliday junction DNA helicase subunit RuvA [Halanaerobium sp. MA284_MarDTE_T2]RCW80201.1 Holliday junction DNA helicase subunit RuvA [Halanaerobium sp. DL-01]